MDWDPSARLDLRKSGVDNFVTGRLVWNIGF